MSGSIRFEDVWVEYTLETDKPESIREAFINAVRFRKTSKTRFNAIQGLSFDISPGESVGFIGGNGAGKSTLLKLMAGILSPDRGSVTVRGQVAALLELGAGFHFDLSGRENIRLNGSLMGLSSDLIERNMEEIVAFSELGPFIHNPLKTYSSGMVLRLGFSIAAHLPADILLIDEVLAVGDESFQRKCYEKIREFQEAGKTLVLISHDMNAISKLCPRVHLLHRGKIVEAGPPGRVIGFYMRTAGERKGMTVLQSGQTSAIFNNGRITLFRKGEEITTDAGIFTELGSGNRLHLSLHSDWTILESTESTCVARGRFPFVPAEWVWSLRLAEGELSLEIRVVFLDPLLVQSAIFNVLLNHNYDSWWTDEETGAIPPISASDRVWNQIAVRRYKNGRIGLASSKDLQAPVVELDMRGKTGPICGEGTQEVFNTKYEMYARVLRFQNFDLVDRSTPHPPGEKPFFRGTLRIHATPAKEWLAPIDRSRTLTAGRGSVRFGGNGFQLLYDQKEISHALRVYSSNRSRGKFDGTYEADWDLLERTGGRLTARARFRGLPVSQIWSLEQTDTGFLWTIRMAVREAVEVDREQTNLMLKETFSRWFRGNETGEYPPEFNLDFAGDWECVAEYNAPGEIAAGGKDLPRVTLGATLGEPYRLRIINSDEGFSGRVLQCVRLNRGLLAPGEYEYFSGHIRIGE